MLVIPGSKKVRPLGCLFNHTVEWESSQSFTRWIGKILLTYLQSIKYVFMLHYHTFSTPEEGIEPIDVNDSNEECNHIVDSFSQSAVAL